MPPGSCPPNPPLASFCAEACVVCDLTGYSSRNSLTDLGQAPPGFCAGQLHNTQWVGFVAGSASLTIRIDVSACVQNDGLQIGIYQTVDCTSFNLVSNCDDQVPGNTSQNFTASGLVPGGTYFLVIDGAFGDICDFDLTVLSGSVTAPQITSGVSNILYPTPVCPGGNVTFSATSVFGAGVYTWTQDGNVVGYDQEINLDMPNFETSFQLCVTPSNPCSPTGPQYCETIVVEYPDPEILNETICQGDTYSYQGQSFSSTGNYSFSYVDGNGCDQPVQLSLTVEQPSQKFLEAEICEGTEFYVGNTGFSNSTFMQPVLLQSANGCDSTVFLTLTVHPTYFEYDPQEICQGESYTISDGSTSYTFTQSTTDVFTLQSSEGCDSLVYLELTVYPTPAPVNLAPVICAGASYTVGTYTYTTSGARQIVLESVGGCDSIVNLNLTVRPPIIRNLGIVQVCQGDNFTVGNQNYNTAGSYTKVLTSAAGCDSTVNFTLQLIPNVTQNVSASFCEGGTYTFAGNTLTAPGSYQGQFVSALGCDSIVNLTLVELQNPVTNLQQTLCAGESFSVGDSTYTQSGQYSHIFPAANGCDSVVNLSLTIRPEIVTGLPVTVCAGDTYTVGGMSFTQTGVYTVGLTAANGCDSTVTLDLTVLPNSVTDLPVTVCSGGNYSVGNQTFSTTGLHTVTLMAANGCDSTVNLNLTVRPPIQSNRTVTICSGSSFTLGGQTFTDAGNYQVGFTSVTGCDSTVFLNLLVEDVLIESATVELCEGESYSVGNSVYTATGQYQDDFITPEGCDSSFFLNLTVHPLKFTTLNPSICNGESFSMGGVDYSSTGTYQTTLTQAATGCDSIVTLNLTVLPTPETFLTPSICDGESFTVGNMNYQTAGIYTQVLTAANGCDSTVHLDLTVLDVPETFLVQSICQGETFLVGSSGYSQSGDFTDILTAANGCDSIVYLDLTVLPTSASTIDVLICEGETYSLDGVDYGTTGQFAAVLAAANGCDSTVTLNLTVAPVQQTGIVASICESGSYSVGSSVYDQTGVYRDTLTTVFGCDSIVVLDLTVTDFYQTNLTATLCEGESFTVGSNVYETTGFYTDQFTSQDGCDSFVNLNLTILPIPVTDLTPAICAGESYQVGNSTYTASGIYQDILTAATGCDSIVNLNLTVIPIPEVFLAESICSGETFAVGNAVYNASGAYTEILTAAGGCDSIVHLELTVFPIPETNLDITICDGETYGVGGAQYSVTGNYTDILTAFTGCDSVVNLRLSVLEIPETVLDVEICQGESFGVGASNYASAGQYQDVLTAASGCDSVVHLNLTVHPVYQVTLNEDICDTESFQVGSSSFNVPGSYTVVLNSVNGCDSIITLNLGNHPCQLQWQSLTQATSCAGGADGRLQFTMTVGTPPYQYTLTPLSGGPAVTGTVASNGAQVSLDNLAPGSYEVEVTDRYGIIAGFVETVTQPAPLAAQILHVSQFGQYHISCPDESDGVLEATVQGGTPPYSYIWSNGASTANAQGLSAGDYFLTITDQKGCQTTLSSVLLQPPPIEANVTTEDPNCYGDRQGIIQVGGVSGGVSPYLYAVDDRPFSSASLFANLEVGVYTVKVQDAAGCEWEQPATINQPSELQVDLGPDVTISLGEDHQLLAQTTYEVGLFKWSGNVPLSCNGDSINVNCSNPLVAPMETAIFSVSVVDDKGCSASDKITVYVSKDRPVFIPNAFSPDNDGENDVFMIFANGNVATSVKSFLIFNRWGETMFELYDFNPNDPVYGWDGTHRGRLLNAGIYVFTAEVEFIDGETILYKGDVLLVR